MDIQSIYSLIEDDMAAVDAMIHARLQSEVVLINQLGHYIINSGGKRLRPALAILSARACGYQGQQHANLATIIEFIHTATLLHDDVVDGSELRRGKETANNLWGNEASVLVGDFLYTRSFEMMVEMDLMPLMRILSHTTNIIAEGEVLQLLNCNDPDTSEAAYLEVIHHKTAKLFEAAGQLGAVISGSSPEIEHAMAMYAMQHGNDTQRQVIRHAIEHGERDRIDDIITIINETGAINYTSQAALKEAEQAKSALALLPESIYKEALLSLADFSVERHY